MIASGRNYATKWPWRRIGQHDPANPRQELSRPRPAGPCPCPATKSPATTGRAISSPAPDKGSRGVSALGIAEHGAFAITALQAKE